LLWRFAASRVSFEEVERRAQKLIGVSFYAIALYVGFEAPRCLLAGGRPDASWVGIGLAAVTLLTMPPLAIAKGRIGEKLGSSATKSEGRQNMLCAYLSAALLVGLGAKALFGLRWADPVTTLAIRMSPTPHLAECREKARRASRVSIFVSRAAAVAVVAVWLALAALAIFFTVRFV
jgi:Cation efflux family